MSSAALVRRSTQVEAEEVEKSTQTEVAPEALLEVHPLVQAAQQAWDEKMAAAQALAGRAGHATKQAWDANPAVQAAKQALDANLAKAQVAADPAVKAAAQALATAQAAADPAVQATKQWWDATVAKVKAAVQPAVQAGVSSETTFEAGDLILYSAEGKGGDNGDWYRGVVTEVLTNEFTDILPYRLYVVELTGTLDSEFEPTIRKEATANQLMHAVSTLEARTTFEAGDLILYSAEGKGDASVPTADNGDWYRGVVTEVLANEKLYVVELTGTLDSEFRETIRKEATANQLMHAVSLQSAARP